MFAPILANYKFTVQLSQVASHAVNLAGALTEMRALRRPGSSTEPPMTAQRVAAARVPRLGGNTPIFLPKRRLRSPTRTRMLPPTYPRTPSPDMDPARACCSEDNHRARVGGAARSTPPSADDLGRGQRAPKATRSTQGASDTLLPPNSSAGDIVAQPPHLTMDYAASAAAHTAATGVPNAPPP